MNSFWRNDSTPDAEQALEVEVWMDVLQDCSHSEIRNAWAEYQKTGPRTKSGKLYQPDAGAIYLIVKRQRTGKTEHQLMLERQFAGWL